jgi:hypothetical protein
MFTLAKLGDMTLWNYGKSIHKISDNRNVAEIVDTWKGDAFG